MAYLIQNTVPHSIQIKGVDVTPRLTSFDVSDESAFKNGLVSTTGSLVLSTVWDQSPYTSYSSGEFKRGDVVTIDVRFQDGTTGRHPRGYLYVLASSYSPESESTELEVGCILALRRLIDEVDDLLQYAPMPLDPVSETFEGLNAALASNSKYLYQDNQGNLLVENVMGSDPNTIAAGLFTTVRGVTSLAVSPLSAAEPVPDKVVVSYQVPAAFEEEDAPLVQVDSSESYYFLSYPGLTFQRKEVLTIECTGGIDGIVGGGGGSSGNTEDNQDTACGEAPPKPPDKPPGSSSGGGYTIYFSNCSECFTTSQTTVYLPAKQKQIRTATYDGPAGQIRTDVTETYAPLLEANNQYFSDKFDFCRRVYGSNCNPNGSCPYYGIDGSDGEALLGRIVTTYFYGEANEVVRTVQDTFQTELSSAQSSDWRTGDGREDFDNDFASKHSVLYRSRRVVTESESSNSKNIKSQKITTFTSVTSRGTGLYMSPGTRNNIDALDGIETFVINRSTTNAPIDNAPERINAESAETEEAFTTVIVSNETGLGEYVLEESVPAPLLFDTAEQCDRVADAFALTLSKFILGDAHGLSIGESVRKDIATAWFPTAPFRYYDDKHDTLLAMRMDATSWSLEPDSSAMVTSAIWRSDMDGTVTIPDNVTGNAFPDMGGGEPTPPSGGGGEPGTGGDVPVGNSYRFIVNVHLTIEALVDFHGSGGIVPVPDPDNQIEAALTLSFGVDGYLAAPGALVSGGYNGDVALDYNASVIIDYTGIINADLFATATESSTETTGTTSESTSESSGGGY